MDRGGLALGVAAVALGVAGVALLRGTGAPRAEERPAPAVGEEAADAEVEALRRGLETARREAADARRELARVTERVGRLEQLRADPAGGAPEPQGATDLDAAEDPAAARAEFERLRERIFAGGLSDEEQARFWELARTTGALSEVIASLESAVAAEPGAAERRLALADAYVQKLLSVPDGPERGLWAMKAERQYQEILARDGDHWDARFRLAFSWSQWPDFMNKTPDAIREFETLRSRQEARAPEPRQVQTYLQLAILHRRQGDADKARAVLAAGLERHPGDPDLAAALGAAESR